MGEEFQTGNWWSPSINLFSSLPCSGTANDLRWLNPSPMLHNKTTKVSCDDDSAGSSGSSIVLQEPQQPQLNMMTHDWNQDLLHDSAISQENYSHMLQTVNSSMNCRQEHACQSVFFEQHPSNSFSPSTATASFQDLPPASFPGSYGYTTSLLQTNFDADSHHHQVLLDSSNFGMNSAGLVVPERNNFQFVYNSPSGDIPASFLPQLVPSALTKGGQNRINFYSKHHNGKAWQAESVMKKGGNEPLFKRKRIETPSPLQTFKVRKEKLGDRLTALQQLVSPFGKTDTASVLHEAIEYIKLLHDQVTMLSAPYLKKGQPPRHRQQSLGKINNQEEPKKDLRSRGLCIVPMSITFPVAAETTADFWTSKPGRSFR